MHTHTHTHTHAHTHTHKHTYTHTDTNTHTHTHTHTRTRTCTHTHTHTHIQGVSSRGQPVCSALLLGPTGVGKTELSKVVARELFDDEKHIVRIDMRSHFF